MEISRLFISRRMYALTIFLWVFCSEVLAQGTRLQPAHHHHHDFDIQHYRIAVEFNLAKKAVEGNVVINLTASKNDLTEIAIDAGRMTIRSVKLGRSTALKFRHEGDEKLYISLNRSYPAGANLVVTIAYSATPVEGLTFISPTPARAGQVYQVWSHGQTRKNHYWFPCYDQPNDKATTEMIATVDKRYDVISNGRLISVRPGAKKGLKKWYWKMDRPYSTYLVSVVIGEFAEIKDYYKRVPVTSYVPKGRVEDARLSFARTVQMIDFFAKRTSMDYPFTKYAQATVADFNGGMENITATTLGESLIHDKVASLDFTSEDLLSHELSHSWFGNMVTCADWGELWLNEGFATFMANMWTRHVKGEEEYLYAMFQNQQQSLRAWFQGNKRPIVLGDYDDPDALFDVYPYQRGAAVLNMLMFVLGEDLFWKAINHYLEKYRWRNVKTDDLITAIKESTGQSLEWFFDEWVYKMGHPQFDVSAVYDRANKLKITVKQMQKPDKSKPEYDSPAFFKTPLEIGVTTAAGEKAHRVWIDKAENEFVFDVDSKPLFVNFDRGNRLIKQARLNQSQEELIYQLKHDKDVMGRVSAAIRLRSSQSDASVAALREAVNREGFWGVRAQAVGSLSEMKLPDARSALLEAVRDKDPRVRSASIHSLARLKDPALADLFIGVINHDESLYTIADACRALGQTGAPQAYETLSKTLRRDSWQDTIRIGAIDGLLATGDPRAIEASIGHALPGNSTGVRLAAFRLIAPKAKTDGRAMRILLAAMKEESLPIKLAAISHLGALRDESVITELEKIARSSNLPLAATRAANKAINQIRDPGKGVPSK